MIKIIDNTGIFESTCNGASLQTLLLKINNELYQIVINNESYAKLSIMTPDKKWTELKIIQPQRDYQIDISGSSKYNQADFLPIIKDFLNLIARLHDITDTTVLQLI